MNDVWEVKVWSTPNPGRTMGTSTTFGFLTDRGVGFIFRILIHDRLETNAGILTRKSADFGRIE